MGTGKAGGVTPRTILVAVAVAAAALVSACVPDGTETPMPTPETPPTTTTTTSAPPSSPSPEPTTSSSAIESFPPPPADETEEQAAIRQGWMDYWKVFDSYIKRTSKEDLSEARQVTVPGSSESTQMLDIIVAYRDRGLIAVGDREFRDVVIDSLVEEDGTQSAIVFYCHDGTGLTLVDAKTEERAEIPSIDTLREQSMLQRGEDGVWRVASIRNEVTSC